MTTLELAKEHSDHSGGLEYLYEQARNVAQNLPEECPIVEIGTREGGSALVLLLAINTTEKRSRPLITIDPHGMPYKSSTGTFPPIHTHQYERAMHLLSGYALEHGLCHVHYKMTSYDWCKIWPLIDLWQEGERVSGNPFAFVYLDGEHTPQAVSEELSWFRMRMHPEGAIVIDDTEHVENHPDFAELFKANHKEGNRLYITGRHVTCQT